MHSGEDKSNMVKLPEGMIPSVQTTQNEVLGRKYTGEEVTFVDSGDEEYIPVIYGSGGENEHAKISNDTESGSADQKNIPQGKGKSSIHDQVKDGDFASKDAQEEVTNYEIKDQSNGDCNPRDFIPGKGKVKLPEGMIPSVQTTQNEVLGGKYIGEEVTFDDSGDEEYFPVVYGSGGGNEHVKISNDTESGSADQKNIPQEKGKSSIHDQVKDGDFASKDAREEVTNYEAIRNEATSKLNSVYEEILPVIEAHGLDNQDGVPFSVVEKWTEAQCSKYKADFDLYFSMIKNVIMCPRPATDATAGSQTGSAEEGAGSQIGDAEEGVGSQTSTAEEGAGSQTGDAEEGAGSQTGAAE